MSRLGLGFAETFLALIVFLPGAPAISANGKLLVWVVLSGFWAKLPMVLACTSPNNPEADPQVWPSDVKY